MRPTILLVLAMMLGGCAGSGSTTPATETVAEPLAMTLPEAKAIILAEKARIWKDPYSIRDAKIGAVNICEHSISTRGGMERTRSSCACVELNAKNSMGGYTGLKRTIVLFPNAGGVDTLDGGSLGFERECAGRVPFPELNGR